MKRRPEYIDQGWPHPALGFVVSTCIECGDRTQTSAVDPLLCDDCSADRYERVGRALAFEQVHRRV